METTGGSMSGYSRTGRRVNAITPNRMIVRLITVAKTGRWMDISLIFIERLSASLSDSPALPSRTAYHGDHLRPLEELLMSRADHRHAGLETFHHFHRVGEARAERERAPRHGAVGLHDVREGLIPLGEDGLAGDGEGVLALAQHGRYVGRHAGAALPARIPEAGDDARAPRSGLEHRIDHVDTSSNRVVLVRRRGDVHLRAAME